MKNYHFSVIIRNALYDSFRPLFMAFPSNIIRILFLRTFQIGEDVKIGRSVLIARGADIRSPWNISIGNNVIINKNVVLDGRGGLTIGNNVDIAQDSIIWTAQHDYNDDYHKYVQAPVTIEDYVWLASRTLILPGVVVGRGAVVAAGSVVTKDVEPMRVVGGMPAKVITERKSKLLYKLKAR